MVVNVTTHVKVGFANPFLVCESCTLKVPYWHDPVRCGCSEVVFNYPCGHKANVVSLCPSWGPVNGCQCKSPEEHQ